MVPCHRYYILDAVLDLGTASEHKSADASSMIVHSEGPVRHKDRKHR
jgi:hypothetical protein